MLAIRKGGRCISTVYVNSVAPLLWECAAGHRWETVPSNIRKGSWCPECAGVRRRTLEEMQQVAESRGGSCLSNNLQTVTQKLTWRCSTGHEWQARASSIIAGNWCPFCARNQRLTIDEMERIAQVSGGRCLSTAYKNGRSPLLWECQLGHRWKACPAKVKSGSRRKGTWCLACYGLRRKFHSRQSIERMKAVAISRGGKCLSAEYLNSKCKMIWECARGHVWQALPVSVVHGTWCPVCARNQRLCLSQLQSISGAKGGRCMSDQYTNERTALQWQCSEGHRWSATPGKVKRGSWCPVCARAQRRRRGEDLGASRRPRLLSVAPQIRSHRSRIVQKTHSKRKRSGKFWSLPVPVGNNGADLSSLPKRGTQT
jgi:hypothetical protein